MVNSVKSKSQIAGQCSYTISFSGISAGSGQRAKYPSTLEPIRLSAGAGSLLLPIQFHVFVSQCSGFVPGDVVEGAGTAVQYLRTGLSTRYCYNNTHTQFNSIQAEHGDHGDDRSRYATWQPDGYRKNQRWRSLPPVTTRAARYISLPCGSRVSLSPNHSQTTSIPKISRITKSNGTGSSAESDSLQSSRVSNSQLSVSAYLKYSRTKKGVLTILWRDINTRSRHRGWDLDFTRDEFLDFVLISNGDKFEELYEGWVASDFDRWSKPSIDRLNSREGYSLQNIRLVTWRENFWAYKQESKFWDRFRKTYCKRGHLLAETRRRYGKDRGVICIVCQNIHKKKYRAKLKNSQSSKELLLNEIPQFNSLEVRL